MFLMFLSSIGVNGGHPLLEPVIDTSDLHTNNATWGTQDNHGHGSQMAGLALYGDLTKLLASNAPLVVGHKLESVKLLPQDHSNQGEPYGELTIEAVRPTRSYGSKSQTSYGCYSQR